MGYSHDIQAWGDGVAFGRQFAEFALAMEGDTAEALRDHLAGLTALRSGHSDAEWREWAGQGFAFDTGGFGVALSVVWAIHAALKRAAVISDLNSAKEMCFPIWSVWLAPDRPARMLEMNERERLRRPDFVRGFVDAAVSGYANRPRHA
jgi:hypothetical protein